MTSEREEYQVETGGEDSIAVSVAPPKKERGDDADHASIMENYEREISLSKILLKTPRAFPPDFDYHCIDCGDPIPEQRLKLYCIRCFDCQTIFEKKNKR